MKEYQAALALFESLNLKKETAGTLLNIGNMFQALNDFENARHALEKSLRLHEELNSLNGIATTKNSLAAVYEKKGEDERAIELYCEALAICEQVSDKSLIATVCLNLGGCILKKQRIKGDERGN